MSPNQGASSNSSAHAALTWRRAPCCRTIPAPAPGVKAPLIRSYGLDIYTKDVPRLGMAVMTIIALGMDGSWPPGAAEHTYLDLRSGEQMCTSELLCSAEQMQSTCIYDQRNN